MTTGEPNVSADLDKCQSKDDAYWSNCLHQRGRGQCLPDSFWVCKCVGSECKPWWCVVIMKCCQQPCIYTWQTGNTSRGMNLDPLRSPSSVYSITNQAHSIRWVGVYQQDAAIDGTMTKDQWSDRGRILRLGGRKEPGPHVHVHAKLENRNNIRELIGRYDLQ